MKRVMLAASLLFVLGLATSAFAVTFEIHGDLNNRLQILTNQQNFFDGNGPSQNRTGDHFFRSNT